MFRVSSSEDSNIAADVYTKALSDRMEPYAAVHDLANIPDSGALVTLVVGQQVHQFDIPDYLCAFSTLDASADNTALYLLHTLFPKDDRRALLYGFVMSRLTDYPFKIHLYLRLLRDMLSCEVRDIPEWAAANLLTALVRDDGLVSFERWLV